MLFAVNHHFAKVTVNPHLLSNWIPLKRPLRLSKTIVTGIKTIFKSMTDKTKILHKIQYYMHYNCKKTDLFHYYTIHFGIHFQNIYRNWTKCFTSMQTNCNEIFDTQ